MDELGDLLEEGEKDHYLDLTKNFDASTVGAPNAGVPNAVENKDYLAMMSPPDIQTQMSVSPSHQEDYLEPRSNFQGQGQFQGQSFIKQDSDDNYLIPNGKNNFIELKPLMTNGMHADVAS